MLILDKIEDLWTDKKYQKLNQCIQYGMIKDIDPPILRDEYKNYMGRYEEPFCSKIKIKEPLNLGDIGNLKVINYHIY